MGRVPSQPTDLSPGSAVDRVVDTLRSALFDGAIEPGTPLREIHIATTMGVGRSTVREALKILAKDGLARRVHNKGVVVTALSDHDIAEIFRARQILEVAGLRAARGAPRAALQAVRTAVADYERSVRVRDQQSAVAAHLGFHCAIVGLLGSSRLLETAQALVADVRLAMAAAARTHNDSPQQVAEHASLLRLIESARVDDAVRDLTAHLERGKESLLVRVPL